MLNGQIISLLFAGIFGNVGVTSFYLLQATQSKDPTSLLIAGITGIAAALVTVFFIYRKEVKERNAANEEHAKNIQAIYEKVVVETNTNIKNNNRLTEENIAQVKELSNTIKKLPDELRALLKERK